ncbi:MAG: flagellar hook-associated protein FlgK [Phycisphaerales bacterium]|nr:flagellar hook-associated protein FlgK [Phycisphaerales bacterium]
MSLTAAIQIGHSALTASQIGLQVAGNNLANAATPGYSRQVLALAPTRGQLIGGVQVGRGVSVQDVRRQIDSALESRLRAGVSDQAASDLRVSVYGAIESTLNELTDFDLSSQLSSFFGSWSELANLTQSSSVAVQRGQALASHLRRLDGDLTRLRDQVDAQLGSAVARADELLQRVAGLNQQIVAAEAGTNENAALRDQRDQALVALAELMDISSVEMPDGTVNVLVGSTPIVQGPASKSLGLLRETRDGELNVAAVVGDDQRELAPASGMIGALLADRESAINGVRDTLNRLSAQIIFQVNRIHASGASESGLTQVRSTMAIGLADQARPLNDPANQTLSDLPFAAESGGFYVHVRHQATGQEQIVRVDVDLDGIDDAGAPGTADDTSASDIVASLDGISGISASFGADGRITIAGDSGYTFNFAEDSSGALAVLGVNTFFTGSSASDIGVNEDLAADPSRVLSGRLVGGDFVANGTAVELAEAQDEAIDALEGRSVSGFWRDAVQVVGVGGEAARSAAQASSIIRESLEAQRAAVSGVSVDEESINLMNFQRQYQGAARLITIADELLNTLMNII